jgi:fructosamine-3-kinase
MLAAEADGLRALAATARVRVPAVIREGGVGATAYMALEWLDLRSAGGGAALGRALADVHRAPPPRGPRGERFGWHSDNWIGGTPQLNAWNDDWCAFFRDRRLWPQLELAKRNGFAGIERVGRRVLDALPVLLRGHRPSPSLVHGDLWSGNAGTLDSGEPVVFDPAVYVGDRETDVAMTQLFGGFGEDFLAAYTQAYPLAAGYAIRCDVYNAYHLVNHVNLFGEGYVARTHAALARLVEAASAR